MAVVLQIPVGVRGEPVAAIAIEHDRVIVGDAAAAEQLAERLRAEEVAANGVLQVGSPVEADRTRYVALCVERRVLIDLDDSQALVVEVLLQPVGVD